MSFFRLRRRKPYSTGKKAIGVGCCNSGHDIAQDFYENGYDTTIVQRVAPTLCRPKRSRSPPRHLYEE